MQRALHELSPYVFTFTKQLGSIVVSVFQMADRNSESVSTPLGPPRMLQLSRSPALAHASLVWRRLASPAQGALLGWPHASPTCDDAGLAIVTQVVPSGTGTHHRVLLLAAELVTVSVVQAAEFPCGYETGILAFKTDWGN